MTEFESIKRKLDHITKLLERLCNTVDPYPGYYQTSDRRWRNRQTGVDMFEEMQTKAMQNLTPSMP